MHRKMNSSSKLKYIKNFNLITIFLCSLAGILCFINCINARYVKIGSADYYQLKSDYINNNFDKTDGVSEIITCVINDLNCKYNCIYMENDVHSDNKADLYWSEAENIFYLTRDVFDRNTKEKNNTYLRIQSKIDTIIDCGIPNLINYYKRCEKELSIVIKNYEEWQPGDVVIYEKSLLI